MLRKLLALFLLPLLASCGESEDFSLDVDRSAAIVSQELARIDPNVLVAGSGLTPVKSESEDGTIRFTMLSPEGEGELVFEVVETGPQSSTVKVALDIPKVTRDAGSSGESEYLDEAAVQHVLREALASWKGEVEATRPTENALAEVSEIVSTLAVGLQDFERFESLAGAAMFDSEPVEVASAPAQSDASDAGGDWGGENAGWADDDAGPTKTAANDDGKEEESDWGAGAN